MVVTYQDPKRELSDSGTIVASATSEEMAHEASALGSGPNLAIATGPDAEKTTLLNEVVGNES